MARCWLTYFVKARTTGPLIFLFANGSSPKFFEKKNQTMHRLICPNSDHYGG